MNTVRKPDVLPVRMTCPEVEVAYPNQWVVLGDLDVNEVTIQIRSGVVRGVGKTRREASDAANTVNGECWACIFTGPVRSPYRW